MTRKELTAAGAISTVLYFTLPGDLSRLQLLAIVATVFVAVRTIAWMISDIQAKRDETNISCLRMRRPRHMFHGVGPDDWPMITDDGRIIR